MLKYIVYFDNHPKNEKKSSIEQIQYTQLKTKLVEKFSKLHNYILCVNLIPY